MLEHQQAKLVIANLLFHLSDSDSEATVILTRKKSLVSSFPNWLHHLSSYFLKSLTLLEIQVIVTTLNFKNVQTKMLTKCLSLFISENSVLRPKYQK